MNISKKKTEEYKKRKYQTSHNDKRTPAKKTIKVTSHVNFSIIEGELSEQKRWPRKKNNKYSSIHTVCASTSADASGHNVSDIPGINLYSLNAQRTEGSGQGLGCKTFASALLGNTLLSIQLVGTC